MGEMKLGVIVEGRGSQVRVQFDDNDGVISPWLDAAQNSTIGKKSFRRFKVGEVVRCYLDRKGESGEALYAIYNDENPAPIDGDDVFYEEMPDGSVLKWEGGAFSFTNTQGVSLTVVGPDVMITGNLKVSGDLTVEGDTDLKDTKINDIPQVGN